MQATCVEGVSLLSAHFVRHRFDRHSHEEWSIGVTHAGQQVFRCRGANATSRSGNVIVFRPEDAHDGHAGDGGGFRYQMVYVPEATLAAWAAEHAGARQAPRFASALVHDRMGARQLSAAAAALMQPRESLRGATFLRHALMGLMARHGQRLPAAAPERREVPWLRRVRERLEACPEDDVTVEQLAALAQVSRVHLTRSFTAVHGMAPHEYLNQARLRRAQRALQQGAGLAEAAAGAGFADQSHFTRRFKSAHGVTPGCWLRDLARPGGHLLRADVRAGCVSSTFHA